MPKNAEPWELPLVDEVHTGKWKFHGYNEFLIKCHIQDIPENGADVGELNKFFSETIFGETTYDKVTAQRVATQLILIYSSSKADVHV